MTDLSNLMEEIEDALAAPGFVPSPQQTAVFNWIERDSGNAIIVAVAGAGKTTTLLEASRLMAGRVAMCAYNKKIADEIASKLVDREIRHVQAGTFHSFGFRAYRRVHPNVKVDGNKTRTALDALNISWALRSFVEKLVSLVRQQGVGVHTAMDDLDLWYETVDHFALDELLGENVSDELVSASVDVARRVLDYMVKTSHEVIDFDDMLWLPLVQNLRIDKFDWVLVDEAQDSNATRRELARRMVNGTGRLIAVGDPGQAIYGFTGANSDALDIIRRDFNAVELPLTVTYRCPRSIVAVAQQWVSHIEAHPSAPMGRVGRIYEDDLLVEADFAPKNALLCRNTKPLVELAYTLIRRSIPCHVEGRDIGAGLIALTKKWKLRSVDSFLTRLDEWSERECAKLMKKGLEARVESVRDRVETLHVIAANLPAGAEIDDLVRAIQRLFEDSDGKAAKTFTLSTIHKSKGREWPTVYWYGANVYQPSKYAKKAWQMEQETNLMYVAATRAMETLIMVDAS